MNHILVVEDDAQLNKLACGVLAGKGYAVTACHSAMEAFDALAGGGIDLIVSDIMMPQMDGFAFAQKVRRQNENIPILFMTARDDIQSKHRGFDLGADDYLVKPVDMEELAMRVGALLRRANINRERKLTVGNLTLNADEVSAAIDGRDVPITVKEFNILYKLLSFPKRTFTRAQLKDEFWGVESDSSLRSVDVYINKLREKFGGCGGFEIATVHGLGYKAILK